MRGRSRSLYSVAARLPGDEHEENTLDVSCSCPHFERGHLKEAFSTVRTMQSALGQRYQTGRFG